jgi:putative tryptophan/tyrosine transport system substrate-binding protein
MQRRTFMLLLGTTAGVPRAASAQQKPIPVVGFLHSAAAREISDLLGAFRTGLKESGFTEGQNVAIEYRYGENESDRPAALAEELVARKVDVIAVRSALPPARSSKVQNRPIYRRSNRPSSRWRSIFRQQRRSVLTCRCPFSPALTK